MMSSISVEDLLKHLGSLNIIDIRSIQNYNNNHIPGSINVPFDNLILTPEKYLNPRQSYCLYCQKGLSSKSACQILSRKGYKVMNLQGGYEEWVLKH